MFQSRNSGTQTSSQAAYFLSYRVGEAYKLACALIQPLPRRRQAEDAVVTLDKTHAQLVLKRGQAAADGGMAHKKPLCRPGEVFGLSECQKHPQLFNLHLFLSLRHFGQSLLRQPDR